MRVLANVNVLPSLHGFERKSWSTDWWVVNSWSRYHDVSACASEMTARAPAARKPAAKLSIRSSATASVGAGMPGSELPGA